MGSVFNVKSFNTSLVFERFIAVKISTKIVKGKTTLMVCAPKGVTNKVPFPNEGFPASKMLAISNMKDPLPEI